MYKITTCLQNTIRDLDQSAGLAEDGPDGLHARGALAVHHGHPGLVLECFYSKFLMSLNNDYLVNIVEEAELPGHHHQHHRDVHQHQALETQSIVTRELRLQNVMSLLNQSFYIKEL